MPLPIYDENNDITQSSSLILNFNVNDNNSDEADNDAEEILRPNKKARIYKTNLVFFKNKQI